jgi:hypothetical protein
LRTYLGSGKETLLKIFDLYNIFFAIMRTKMTQFNKSIFSAKRFKISILVDRVFIFNICVQFFKTISDLSNIVYFDRSKVHVLNLPLFVTNLISAGSKNWMFLCFCFFFLSKRFFSLLFGGNNRRISFCLFRSSMFDHFGEQSTTNLGKL